MPEGQLRTVPNLGACSSSIPTLGLSVPVANYHNSFKLLFKLTPHFLKRKKNRCKSLVIPWLLFNRSDGCFLQTTIAGNSFLVLPVLGHINLLLYLFHAYEVCLASSRRLLAILKGF